MHRQAEGIVTFGDHGGRRVKSISFELVSANTLMFAGAAAVESHFLWSITSTYSKWLRLRFDKKIITASPM